MWRIVGTFMTGVMFLAYGLGTTAVHAEIAFEDPVEYPVEGQPGSLATADFDGINGPDVATGNFRTRNVSVLLNNGNATFAPPVTYPVGTLPSLVGRIAGADFDGVNGPDLAVTDYGLALSNVSVLLNATSVLINDLVTLDDVDTAFNPTDNRAPAGVFTITAMFTNISVTPIRYPFFQVTSLTSGDVLLNADGGAGGVGATLTADVSDDQILSPGESFTADFDIGLQNLNPFTFIVDLLGQPVGSLIEGAVRPCVVQPSNFHDGNCYETSFLSGQGFLENTVFDLRTSPTGIHFDTTSPFVVDLSSSVGITSAEVTATFGDFVGPTQAETLHLEFAPGSFEAGDRLIFNVNIDYGPRGSGITFSAFMDDGREGCGLFVGEFTDPGNAGVIVEAR